MPALGKLRAFPPKRRRSQRERRRAGLGTVAHPRSWLLLQPTEDVFQREHQCRQRSFLASCAGNRGGCARPWGGIRGKIPGGYLPCRFAARYRSVGERRSFRRRFSRRLGGSAAKARAARGNRKKHHGLLARGKWPNPFRAVAAAR